jgi:hypothetical protein
VLFYVHEVADAVGLGQMDAEVAARYLGEKGLIRVLMGPIISISQAGVDELETALEHPKQATTHFPAPEDIAWSPVTAQPATPQNAREESAPERQPAPEKQSAPEKQPAQEEQTWQAPIHPVAETPVKPLPPHMAQDENSELAALELQRICEAIGLDPNEFTGELAPHHNPPVNDPRHGTNPESILEALQTEYEDEEHPSFAVSHQADQSSFQPEMDSRSPFSFKQADLDVILESLRFKLPKLGFAPDDLAEAEAEIDTARAQLASPKPKPHVLAASLKTLSSLLENASWSWTSDTRENLVAIRDFQSRLSA